MSNYALPTKEQVQWADCELGVIIHYDLPVFAEKGYDFRKHYGDPLPLSIFDPKKLDTDQWVKAARDMGAKYAVLVAKHCTGFCLWPTSAHAYSVKNTPYGKDIVGSFFKSCEKYGVKPGLYYSASCNQFMNVDNPGTVKDGDTQAQKRYNEMVLAQLTELWTRYGKVFEIWFDGGCLPVEKGGPDITSLLHKLQPDAVVFQGPEGTKSLLRWVGNERGVADIDCSATVDFLPSDSDGTVEMHSKGDPFGNTWCPAESDLPNRDALRANGGGWFWAPDEEDTIKSGEALFATYLESVGRGTNMLIGMGIDTTGQFPQADIAQFEKFAQLRREAFETPLAQETEYTSEKERTFTFETDARYLVLEEDIAYGERVLSYRFDCYDKDGKCLGGQCRGMISHKRILPLMENVRTVKVTLLVQRDEPKVRVSLY